MADKRINFSIIDMAGETKEFTTIASLKDFCQREVEFWEEALAEGGNSKFINKLTNGAKTNLDYIFQKIDSDPDKAGNGEPYGEQQFTQRLLQQFRNQTHNLRSQWLYSKKSYISTLIDISSKHGEQVAQVFLNWVLGKQVGPNSKETWLGCILAYEFQNPTSEIITRSASEKESLDALREQYQSISSDALVSSDAFKESMTLWKKERKQEYSDWVASIEEERSSAQTEHKKEFDDYMTSCREQKAELEKTYEEHLKLSKPAEYWEKSAAKYRREGWIAVTLMSIFVIFGLIHLQDFYVHWLKGDQSSLDLSTLQGVFLFATILAIYAFSLKTLSKLTFSAFHLMRDAEEREQLTYLYLSLIKEDAADKESRDIILQSLFSRSETGLLASESGSTMPKGFMDLLKGIQHR